MKKYIDADALIAGIKQAKQTEFELAIKARRHKNMVAIGIHESHVGFCNQILDAVKAAEPEDVRPVVFCSKCKYNNSCFTQSFVSDESVIPFDRNSFFCADGEIADILEVNND